MPENAIVTVRYGPYESCGVVHHRTQRLEGLRALLEAGGHTVEFEEIDDRDFVELIVNGETIYHCNIKDLDFGGDGKLDDHCKNALTAVKEAY